MLVGQGECTKRGQDGALFPDWKQTICGKEIPLVMLGDPAYPLLRGLWKHFQTTAVCHTNKRLLIIDSVKLES